MSHPTSEIDLLLSYVFTTLEPSGEGPRANKSKVFATKMSGSDCCTPKDGRHRCGYSLLHIFFDPKHVFRVSLYAPREHCRDSIPVANGVSVDAAFRVGYKLPILLKSILTASREHTHKNQFLLYFSNSYVPRTMFAFAGTQFA